ncbi:MAG: hypothetical protein AAF211_07490, partial [Myxococcota bacterium]
NADTTEVLEPGDYGRVVVNSGGTLVLADGDFTFTALTVNAAAHLDVGETSIRTGALTWRGDHTGVLDVTVWGEGWTALGADLEGRVFAPDATLQVSGAARRFAGQLLGGRVLVEPGVEVVCED